MKARLVDFYGELHLLICNGNIATLSFTEARNFLLNFDDPNYYTDDTTWAHEGVTIETFKGSTIATVDDLDILHVQDGAAYRRIMSYTEAKYLSAKEYAEKHGKKPGIIRRFCLEGRFPGAVLKARTWLIPEDAPYPDGDHVKS